MEPCGPDSVPVSEPPSVARVRVPFWAPIGVFIVVFQTPSALLISSLLEKWVG